MLLLVLGYHLFEVCPVPDGIQIIIVFDVSEFAVSHLKASLKRLHGLVQFAHPGV